MVGAVIATDIASEFNTTIADYSLANLEKAKARAAAQGRSLTTVQADLSNTAEVRRLASNADIVLGALASHLGFAALKTVIECGRNYCDISFMGEDAPELDALARKHDVTAIVDMGVAPGMSNLLAADLAGRLDTCDELNICVGGLPRDRRWPFQYKAGFSPADVIEEYTRPSRLVENGKVVIKPALTDPELIDFDGIGTLEAVNTDGLRSLVNTIRGVPVMREKTLRYPGHYELMRVFRDTGLFSKTPITLKSGQQVVPLEVTSALLFPKWTYQPGEEDLTVMRIEAIGSRAATPTRLAWDLLDYFDTPTSATSMSRTTAFPCTIVARLLSQGRIPLKGVLPPELLAPLPGIVAEIVKSLAEHGITYRFSQIPRS
jgi:hypothetical protein